MPSGRTLPLLREHLERLSGQRLSESTFRRQMRARGMRYKRPLYSLKPDPEAKKRTIVHQLARLPPSTSVWV